MNRTPTTSVAPPATGGDTGSAAPPASSRPSRRHSIIRTRSGWRPVLNRIQQRRAFRCWTEIASVTVCPVRIVTNEIVVQISLGQLESVVVEDIVIPIPSGQKIPSFQNKPTFCEQLSSKTLKSASFCH